MPAGAGDSGAFPLPFPSRFLPPRAIIIARRKLGTLNVKDDYLQELIERKPLALVTS